MTRIFVAGHRGMVGSAVLRALRNSGHREILTATRAELDLTDQRAVKRFFLKARDNRRGRNSCNCREAYCSIGSNINVCGSEF